MSSSQDAPHGSLGYGAVFFSPNGRITQNQYWIGVVAIFVGNVAVNFLGPLGILLWGLLVYCGFCVYGKRLHDIGKSIWVHAIVWLVVLIIGIGSLVMSWGAFEILANSFEQGTTPTEEDIMEIMPELMSELMPMGIGYMVNLVIWLAYTVWIGATESQKFDNRFGRGPAGDTF